MHHITHGNSIHDIHDRLRFDIVQRQCVHARPDGDHDPVGQLCPDVKWHVVRELMQYGGRG